MTLMMKLCLLKLPLLFVNWLKEETNKRYSKQTPKKIAKIKSQIIHPHWDEKQYKSHMKSENKKTYLSCMYGV